MSAAKIDRPRAVRVLMFGWEFPPYQAGGLATATLGLAKGLLRTGVSTAGLGSTSPHAAR